MDDLKNSPIFELSKLAERCTIGYETLYHQTKLSFTAQNYCSLDLYDHANDADDEITDLSGECLDSSSELKFTPKEYLICNGNKPLSFIIRRCGIDSQSQPSFKLSKTSKVLSYGSDIIENKCQSRESSYESHIESSTPEVINNALESDSSDKHEKISSPKKNSHLNIGEVCLNDVQNDGGALFGIYNNQESMSRPLINQETSIVSYENKSLLCSVENSEENFRNNSNLEQQFPALAINLDDNYKERAYVSTCEKKNATTIEIVGMGNDVLIDEDTTELQVKNGFSLKPQGATVGLDANFSQTYNFANPNGHVTEECVNNDKVQSNHSFLNLASVHKKKDRGYDGKYSGAGTNNDNLMPLGKLGKCLVKNNNFEFHCNSSKILLERIEVNSGFYNEESVRKSEMKNLSSQLLSNEINHVDSRENVNKYDTQNTYEEIINSKMNVRSGELIYTNKLSLIQNEACIHNDVEETCLNENKNSGKTETISPIIHSEYFIQTDLCHNLEPLSSNEELSKESQEKFLDNHHSQNSCDVKRSSNTEEYLLIDKDSTATKGNDKTVVNAVENATDTMSPVLTVPAEHFASFEKVYDNMYNQNSQTVAEKLVPQSNNNDDKDCQYSLDGMNMTEASGNITASDFQRDINSEDIEKSSLEIFENETKISPIRSNGGILNSEVYENDTKIVSIEESNKPNLKMFVIQPCESPLKMKTSVNLPSVQESNTDNQNVSAVEHFKDSYLNNDDLTTLSSISLSPKNPIRTIGMDETENPAEIIINDQYLPVNMETESNIMEEDTTDFVERQTSSVLLDELTESRTSFTNIDSTSDQFSKHDKVHSNSFMAQTFTEDAMDCPYTEDTVFLQHSPLLFSSDDENSYCTVTDIINNQEKEEPKKPNNFNEILTQEQKKLHRLQEALVGVPPPPSVTIPQIDVTEILKLLKENEKLMISAASKNNIDSEATEIKKTRFHPSSNDHIKNISWPQSKSYCYYDIQFNHGKVSEEFESLCQKLRERYVGCETTSSCTIWFTRDISNKISSMTNKGKNFGRSPGRRLSHLARRRQTFSSANLLNNGVGQLPGVLPSTTSERHLLMVEVKKNDRRQKSKNIRPQKEVPSADTSKLQQTKRALFKSPPNIHKRVPSASKSRSGSKKDRSNIDRHKIQNSKRALWPAESNDNNKSRIGHDRALTNISGHINVYGKRKRDDSDVVMQSNKCSRRLLFSDSPKRKTDRSHDKNHKSNNNGENGLQISSCARSSHKNTSAGLSERHRKKLLWAIAEALRVEGISMSHESFRPCASMLGYLVRSLLPDLNCKREGSTSDLMLKLSKQHVKDIVKNYQTAGSNKVCKT